MMYSDFDLQCEIANNFMSNKVALATKYCYNIIHNNHGQVADDFYIMLFDMLKVQNAKDLFDSATEQYHKITGRLPPDWENKDFNKMLSEFNILELKGPLDASIANVLNNFYNSCNTNGFGRLDFNQLNLKDSDSLGMNMLLQNLYKLKKIKEAEILLMGENIILNFNPKEFMLSLQKKQEIEKDKQNNDKTQIINPEIKHNASLMLLEKTREEQNNIINKQYKDAYNDYKLEEKTILNKILEIDEKLNPSRGVGKDILGHVNQTAKRSMRDNKDLEAEKERLRMELEELQARAPKPNDEMKESFIENIIREKHLKNNDNQSQQELNNEEKEKREKAEIAKKEELLFLLKLEILQWNGEQQKYLELAEQYSHTYKKFATDYQIEFESKNRIKRQNRIGTFQITTAEENNFNSVSKNTPVIATTNNEINSHNLDSLLQYLDNIDPNQTPVVFMNLYKTNFFTYEAANALMLFMQNQKFNGRNYDLYIKNANSLIKVIFRMSGLSEYIKY